MSPARSIPYAPNRTHGLPLGLVVRLGVGVPLRAVRLGRAPDWLGSTVDGAGTGGGGATVADCEGGLRATAMSSVGPAGISSSSATGISAGVTAPYPRAALASPVRLSSAYRMPCAVTRYTWLPAPDAPGDATVRTTAPCPTTVTE